ncbi:hypothetical protein [Streptomyces natalensis]|uniref:hypothetical protein n=1 Tax=Streptomyces natalensis TaxID=68242 RepID=UPI0012FED282|nr:hypothetical protein [Streptomyces natalensis]
MSQDAEAKKLHAPPPEYAVQWLLPAGIGALGVVAFVTGAIAAGIVLLIGAAGIGYWLSRRAQAAEDARARWERSLICKQCTAVFPREDAVAV